MDNDFACRLNDENFIEKLSEKIFEKILEKQKTYDSDFKNEIQLMLDEKFDFSTIEYEIKYLTGLMFKLEEDEMFEEAAIIQRKIQFLRNQLER